MLNTYYVAGWNIPGCLPEMEPQTFENEADANEWIVQERQAFQVSTDKEGDPYVYWVEPIIPADEYDAYRLACECENLDAHSREMWKVHGCPEGPV